MALRGKSGEIGGDVMFWFSDGGGVNVKFKARDVAELMRAASFEDKLMISFVKGREIICL